MKSIGIVIPAYNEKENILKLIKKIKKNLKCTIIIVDDSADLNTQKILKKIKLKILNTLIVAKNLEGDRLSCLGLKNFLKLKKILTV